MGNPVKTFTIWCLVLTYCVIVLFMLYVQCTFQRKFCHWRVFNKSVLYLTRVLNNTLFDKGAQQYSNHDFIFDLSLSVPGILSNIQIIKRFEGSYTFRFK